jgi:hypothetical protein
MMGSVVSLSDSELVSNVAFGWGRGGDQARSLVDKLGNSHDVIEGYAFIRLLPT